MRPNLNLMKATLTGALGGLLFGFDTVVIAGAIDALTKLYNLSPQQKGLTVAIGLVGTVIGALGAGRSGKSWAAARRCASPQCSMWSPPSAADWRGTGLPSWSSASSAGWALAPRRCWARFTLRSWRRPSGAGGWWAPSSSTWSSASWWPTPRTTPSAPAPGRDGVALAGGRGGYSRRRLPGAAVRHSAQPALVGLAATASTRRWQC